MSSIKNPLLSKTLWVNLLALAGMFGQQYFGWIVSPEDQVAGLAAVNLVLRMVTKAPLNWSAPIKNQAGRSATSILLALAIVGLLIAPLLTGCGWLGKKIDDGDLATQLVVRAATGRVLDEHPDWTGETYRITSEVIQLAESDQDVDLAELETAVVDRIAWSRLNPDERDLLRLLISSVRTDLEAYLSSHGVATPPETAVRVIAVLSWINQAAEIRMPHGAAAKFERMRSWQANATRPDGDGKKV